MREVHHSKWVAPLPSESLFVQRLKLAALNGEIIKTSLSGHDDDGYNTKLVVEFQYPPDNEVKVGRKNKTSKR